MVTYLNDTQFLQDVEMLEELIDSISLWVGGSLFKLMKLIICGHKNYPMTWHSHGLTFLP
jgi:hypothetical protein